MIKAAKENALSLFINVQNNSVDKLLPELETTHRWRLGLHGCGARTTEHQSPSADAPLGLSERAELRRGVLQGLNVRSPVLQVISEIFAATKITESPLRGFQPNPHLFTLPFPPFLLLLQYRAIPDGCKGLHSAIE